MTEIKKTETSADLIIPLTGEQLALDAPTDQLAEAAAYLREQEVECARVRNILGAELTRRLDMENLRKGSAGRFEISVAAPATDWDKDAIREVLDRLVADEIITPGARDRVLEPTVKLASRELSKLIKNLDPEHAAALSACGTPSMRTRSVKIEQLRGEA